MRSTTFIVLPVVLVACSGGPRVAAVDAGRDASIDAFLPPRDLGRDAGARDASVDAPPWGDGGAMPEVEWTLPACAPAHGVIARRVASGTSVYELARVRGFDAEPGRATVVAWGRSPEVVWQTLSETEVIDETLPEALGPPWGAILHTDGPHVLASPWPPPERVSRTSITTQSDPREYRAFSAEPFRDPFANELAMVSTPAGIELTSLSCFGLCRFRIDGDGALLAPVQPLRPERRNDFQLLLFDEASRRGVVLEDIFDGYGRLFVTPFDDTRVGELREVTNPTFEPTGSVSPIWATISGDRVVVLFQASDAFDLPTQTRYVELSTESGEVLYGPVYWRRGDLREVFTVLGPGPAGTVDMFRQPFAPYLPEMFTNHPVELHLRRPLALDVAPPAEVLSLGAGGWVDELRAERVGADIWVVWHETGPCQPSIDDPPMECVGGAYWALLRCDE